MSRPLQVLVVDGEDLVSSAVASVLTRRGHTVTTARNAEDALRHGTLDVLVADLVLGERSGLELLEAFQARGLRPHTVFVTGQPALEDCRRALQLGAAEFLTKPFRLEDLVRAVEARTPNAAHPAGLDRSYTSAPGSAEQAARDVAAHALRAGLPPSTRARIGSVTAELVDNARRHGYVHSRGKIRVEAWIEERELVLRVSDHGLGFDAATVVARKLEDAQQSGLARALALSEDLHLDSELGSGTRATARFTASRVDFEEDDSIDLSEHDFFTPDLARRVLHALKKDETASLYRFSPALAVVVGRLLSGHEVRRAALARAQS